MSFVISYWTCVMRTVFENFFPPCPTLFRDCCVDPNRLIFLVLELMKHLSTEAATTATLYQRCLNVDKIKYLPLKDSGFRSNERIPHKNYYLWRNWKGSINYKIFQQKELYIIRCCGKISTVPMMHIIKAWSLGHIFLLVM